MKNFISIFKYFFIAPFLLYVFNAMAVGVNIYIPINLVTIVIIGFFRIIGFLMLVLLSLMFF